VADLAAVAHGGAASDLVVVGDSDPTLSLPTNVRIHGRYDRDEIGALVARYGITDWLIPSIWPETFSFTTHEALATGLPVHGFALGAQGAALAAHPHGRLIPFDPEGDLAAAVLASLRATVTDVAPSVPDAAPVIAGAGR